MGSASEIPPTLEWPTGKVVEGFIPGHGPVSVAMTIDADGMAPVAVGTDGAVALPIGTLKAEPAMTMTYGPVCDSSDSSDGCVAVEPGPGLSVELSEKVSVELADKVKRILTMSSDEMREKIREAYEEEKIREAYEEMSRYGSRKMDEMVPPAYVGNVVDGGPDRVVMEATMKLAYRVSDGTMLKGMETDGRRYVLVDGAIHEVEPEDGSYIWRDTTHEEIEALGL